VQCAYAALKIGVMTRDVGFAFVLFCISNERRSLFAAGAGGRGSIQFGEFHAAARDAAATSLTAKTTRAVAGPNSTSSAGELFDEVQMIDLLHIRLFKLSRCFSFFFIVKIERGQLGQLVRRFHALVERERRRRLRFQLLLETNLFVIQLMLYGRVLLMARNVGEAEQTMTIEANEKSHQRNHRKSQHRNENA
jgi:hypothetical protein